MIWVADFETTTANCNYFKLYNKCKVLLWCCCSLNDSKKYLGVEISDFIDFFIKKQESNIVYFHNLSFDGDYIIKYLAKIGYRAVNHKDELINKSFRIFRQNGIIYSIRVNFLIYKNRQKYSYHIDFKCSYRLLNAKVETLGQAYEIKKHLDEEDSSFYDIEPKSKVEYYQDRFVEYIKNDVEIVRLALLDFNKTIKSLSFIKKYEEISNKQFNCFKYLTAAALSFALIKKFLFLKTKDFKNENIGKYLQISLKDHEYLKLFFHGGYSEFSPKYQGGLTLTKNILMIDINSAYPFQMTQNLPYGPLLSKKPTGSYVEWVKVSVKSAYLKAKYSNIPFLLNWNKSTFFNSKKGVNEYYRYCPYLQNFTAYYCREEWELIKKMYKVKVLDETIFYQQSKPFLKEFIEELYFFKKKYKSEGLRGLCNSIKIILNSGYGCLAKRLIFDNFYYYEKQYFKGENIDNFEVNNECENLKVWKYHCYRLKDAKEFNKKMVINIGAAAYITAKERVYLMEKILSLPHPNSQFALSDTDSILIVNLDDKTFNKLLNESNSEIGGWDVEKEITSKNSEALLSIFGAKKYAVTDKNGNIKKIRFAGINSREYLTNPDLRSWKKDEINISNASLELIRLADGIILKPKNKTIFKGKI